MRPPPPSTGPPRADAESLRTRVERSDPDLWRQISELLERHAEVEEKLRRNESLLAEAQHLAHVGSWNWDIPEDVVTWSDEQFRIFGMEPRPGTLKLQDVLARVHPDDVPII